jgi:hypothetical protein
MRFRSVSVIGALLLFALAIATWPTPIPTPLVLLLSPPAETHSVSGKISSVGESQFALDTVKNQKPDTIQFLIDENTRIEGKLTIGAPAAVDYRLDGDKMIATRVVVTQASGLMAK